ncbi:MAG: tRNA 2-thiouridine(34) synthase MnmA [Bacteroidales bacterium]|jgi:tRNA-specific 2-thiouridylase|nr:tRNA 2-thiouridine(34) synthase MnmA [Bacteroidales bacterium]
MERKKKVVIGLSGGVDSSVAAWILKEQGYDVEALFMVNWHDTTGLLEGDCPAEHDRLLAQLVAKKLEIPFHEVDLSKEYRQRVVDYMFSEYEKGRTPNPDVLCNREIKFGPFLDIAKKMGADFIATGHYCRKEIIEKEGTTIYRLLAGTDQNKDQSYFLCQLSQEQLAHALFPIGNLEKPEVRRIAHELSLATADRKDSQGICFVGKIDLPLFLQQQLKSKTGDIVEIPNNFTYPEFSTSLSLSGQESDERLRALSHPYSYKKEDGKVVGQHSGAHFYTIGQRKGLNVGGKTEPLFVIDTDAAKNIVYVGMGHQHPGLNRAGLFIPKEEIHWGRPDLEMKTGEKRSYLVRIRYRQPLQNATLFYREAGMYIIFDQLQRGIASGQFAVWYDGEELIGSGVIA